MKIKEITQDYILFDNEDIIRFDHERDCCEYNYADFKQLDDVGRNTDFTKPINFEYCCDGMQNGYYSMYVDIYYNEDEDKVLHTEVEIVEE